ncbi:hypothetical protein CPTSV76_291 [Enterobacteria phage SV76]|nr:hypothetical protein CPTSV76_291 [Enterobacteria phage SV76]
MLIMQQKFCLQVVLLILKSLDIIGLVALKMISSILDFVLLDLPGRK